MDALVVGKPTSGTGSIIGNENIVLVLNLIVGSSIQLPI
jgi:hypothetical protein